MLAFNKRDTLKCRVSEFSKAVILLYYSAMLGFGISGRRAVEVCLAVCKCTEPGEGFPEILVMIGACGDKASQRGLGS